MNRSDPNQRHEAILSLLARETRLSAQRLAEALAVSVQTIRADLRGLDEAGRIRRRHGMAEGLTPSENISHQQRRAHGHAEKTRIALAVAKLVPDGASIALGAGSTVAACAQALARHRALRVFTNDIHVVMALRDAPDIRMSLAGGDMRLRDLDFIGAESCEFFAKIRADFAIFSAGGVAENGGLLDYDMNEIRARRAITACARHPILVLDSSKFAASATYVDGRLSQIDTIVTAVPLPELLQEGCRAAGRQLIVANPCSHRGAARSPDPANMG